MLRISKITSRLSGTNNALFKQTVLYAKHVLILK